jgi:hypothetical protein
MSFAFLMVRGRKSRGEKSRRGRKNGLCNRYSMQLAKTKVFIAEHFTRKVC